MGRAGRLFQLVNLVRGRRLSTVVCLAGQLAVTNRTIHRDVADLQHQGVPIQGAAGVGYRRGSGFDLPPLMFNEGEAKALKMPSAKYCQCCPLLPEPPLKPGRVCTAQCHDGAKCHHAPAPG